MEIIVSPEILERCPAFCGAALEAQVDNRASADALWQLIEAEEAAVARTTTAEQLKAQPAIAATRHMYRLCGKDPSRYRPSAEALARRVLQGKGLYRISPLVDLINLASLRFGYSIGGFDADAIAGPTLTLGIGRATEPYEGIGRGPLNIEGLPVYRDALGGIGTPTSDHERTRITTATRRVLVLVNGYDGHAEAVKACAAYVQELAERFCRAESCRTFFYPTP